MFVERINDICHVYETNLLNELKCYDESGIRSASKFRSVSILTFHVIRFTKIKEVTI